MLMDTGRRKFPVNPQDADTLALGLFYLNDEKIYFYHLSHVVYLLQKLNFIKMTNQWQS